MDKEVETAELTAAMQNGNYIVCYTKCWGCMTGEHFDPERWHQWADGEDVEHAANTGQPDPSGQRCGCYCAGKGEKS